MPANSSSTMIDCANPVEWSHPLNRGLMAWYLAHPQFAGGSRLIDLCRPGDLSRAGTLTGMASPYSSTTSGWQCRGDRRGSFGTSLAFESTDDICTAPNQPFSGMSQMTMVIWAKRRLTNSQVLVTQNTESAISALTGIELYSDNKIYLDCYNGPSGPNANFPFSGTAWAHVAYVFDGNQSGNAGRLKGYLNGVPQTLTFAGGTIAATLSNSMGNLRIGGVYYNSTSARSNGNIEEVRIYNRALTAREIADLYLSSSKQYSDGPLRRLNDTMYSFGAIAAGGGGGGSIIPMVMHLNRMRRAG